MQAFMTIWVIVLLSAPRVAARAVESDTIRVVRRDSAIIVTASSWLGDASGAGPARTVLSRQVIDRMTPLTMASAVALVPGVFVRDYGGIGGLQLVSLRGGSSAQSLVMLDGARLSSAQNGSIDLAAIPVRNIESMEVLRGGVSALYGANAVTGVVNVRMRLPDTTSATLMLSQGAFNEWRTALGATISVGDRTRVGIDADVVGTRGSFPFTTTQFGSTFAVNRQNGDARLSRMVARYEQDDALSATVILRSADRGVPGAVVQGAITQARARLTDDDAMAIVRSSIYSSSRDELWLVATARYLDQRFTDPDATVVGLQGIDVRYVQRDATVSAVWQRSSAELRSTVRIDASHADLQGASIVSRDGETVIRRSLSLTSDAVVYDLFSTDVELRAALRADVFSDVGTAVSPLVSIRRKLSDKLALRAGWSLSFRPPTFNELYYLNYGTRSLRSERASMVDVGVVADPWPWCSIDLTGYTATISDLIVSVPVSPVVTSAQNVGRATNSGAELVMRASALDGRFLAQWSYALQFMRDATGRSGLDATLVPYAVPELATALVQWDTGRWFISAQWSYTGYRYALAGEQFDVMLSPFSITSAQAGLRLRGQRMRGSLMLQCDNLFDASYQVIRGFPMPGRAVRVIASMEMR